MRQERTQLGANGSEASQRIPLTPILLKTWTRAFVVCLTSSRHPCLVDSAMVPAYQHLGLCTGQGFPAFAGHPRHKALDRRRSRRVPILRRLGVAATRPTAKSVTISSRPRSQQEEQRSLALRRSEAEVGKPGLDLQSTIHWRSWLCRLLHGTAKGSKASANQRSPQRLEAESRHVAFNKYGTGKALHSLSLSLSRSISRSLGFAPGYEPQAVPVARSSEQPHFSFSLFLCLCLLD